MSSVKKLLKKCRDLCSYANKSNFFYAEFKNQQWLQLGIQESEFLSLPHSDTETRWNSTYYLVERFLKLQSAIECTLVSKIGKDTNIQFNQSEWDLMEKIRNTLSIFEKSTKLLQFADASISDYLPVVTTIMRDLENETSADIGVKTMKRSLLENMKNRFKDIEFQNELLLSTYLNPKYKHHFFINPETKGRAQNLLVKLISERLDNGEKSDTSKDLMNSSETSVHETSLEKKMRAIIKTNSNSNEMFENDMRSQIMDCLHKYEKAPTIGLKKSSLEYWKKRASATERQCTEIKCQLAKNFLTPPPSSCDVERLFSTTSHILNKERNRLLPQNAEKLLFVHENISRVNYNYSFK